MDVDKVIAGVVVAVATVPAKPFAETTLTEDTVPPVLTVEIDFNICHFLKKEIQ
jgi:hypothetical protein